MVGQETEFKASQKQVKEMVQELYQYFTYET